MSDAMYNLMYLISELVDVGFKITLLILFYKYITRRSR